jgi:NADH-quinone oxidoreductase subunit M
VSLRWSLATLAFSIPLWALVQYGTADMQFVEHTAWIPSIIDFYIGVDGISMPLILLTTFTTVLVVIAGWQSVEKRGFQYFAAFLILEGLMIGVFAALDAAAVLRVLGSDADPDVHHHRRLGRPAARLRDDQVLPVHAHRLAADAGRADLPVLKSGTTTSAALQRMPLTLTEQTFIFLAFFAAFAVKVPMWPVHTWLPDAHVEAPTGGSVMLAAIMLKMGGYGFLRFSLPITPDASRELDWLIIAFR